MLLPHFSQADIADKVDGTNPQVDTHVVKSMIIGGPGAWIPFPSHSLLVYLGPKVLMLALDCRAERKLEQVVTKETYAKTFGEVRKCKGIEQLVLLLGVPIGMSLLKHKASETNVKPTHECPSLSISSKRSGILSIS